MRRRDTGVRGRHLSPRNAVRLIAAAAAATLAVSVTLACTGTGSASPSSTATARTITSTPPKRQPAPPKPQPQPKGPQPKPKPKPKKPTALPVAPATAGTLPQTQAFPSTTDPAFKNLVHDFWLAVTTGDPAYAKPAFFPVTAYEQVKAIADPAEDWQGRLWLDFTLDLAAVRPLVGENAKLVKVIVDDQYAVWVPPGACYNNIGYWHVPGSRVVYRQGGATRSFAIASLISWRGNWYLIHLGALTRAAAVGIVDDPEPGAGQPGPPGGC